MLLGIPEIFMHRHESIEKTWNKKYKSRKDPSQQKTGRAFQF